jgi:hypothetical protein
MEIRFIGHEACPRCGSRDNLAVYDDGHKWCFGCNYYVPPKTTLDSLNRRMVRPAEEELDANGIDTSLFSYDIPEGPKKWIQKYGITDSELRFYQITWCDLRQTLVFPVLRDNKVVLTNERYFGPNPKHPKYLTFGNKSKEVVYLSGSITQDKIVFVEDFVSAIKIRRMVSVMPLFGSTIPEMALPWCAGRFKRAGVWLDLDKAAEAMREAAKLSVHLPAHAIVTTGDPKELSMNQIDKTLKEYKII